LDYMRTKFPDTDIFVFPEYSTGGTDFSPNNRVFDHIADWCRFNEKYVVIGAMQTLSSRPLADNKFFNTAFVIGPEGQTVFKQVKSVPIQFFRDGGPALERRVWKSPFGRIGFAICYDFAFSHVMDDIVGQGADLIIVPSLDARGWGKRAHDVLASIPPFRARSYGIPVFRVVSSGISQAITPQGVTVNRREFGDMQAIMAWHPKLQQGRVPLGHPAAALLAKLSIGWGILLVLWYSIKKSRMGGSGAEKEEQNRATLYADPADASDSDSELEN
ncbi:carbon-nitrogen hydrolase family protein, partial [Planctomycetota bacterium]